MGTSTICSQILSENCSHGTTLNSSTMSSIMCDKRHLHKLLVDPLHACPWDRPHHLLHNCHDYSTTGGTRTSTHSSAIQQLEPEWLRLLPPPSSLPPTFSLRFDSFPEIISFVFLERLPANFVCVATREKDPTLDYLGLCLVRCVSYSCGLNFNVEDPSLVSQFIECPILVGLAAW